MQPVQPSRYSFARGGLTYFCIRNLQSSRREDKGDQRCGEEHFQQRYVALFGLEAFREGLGLVYAEASSGTCVG